MSRRALQLLNGLVALATAILGGMQLIFGINSPIYASFSLPASPVLDSNLRFFGGMGLGLALLLFWILPTIERRTDLYRVFWLCAFLGGVGRLISVPVLGWPAAPIVGITVLEVVGAPAFIYWQHRVARAAARSSA